jgi:signal transduction histidine kinase
MAASLARPVIVESYMSNKSILGWVLVLAVGGAIYLESDQLGLTGTAAPAAARSSTEAVEQVTPPDVALDAAEPCWCEGDPTRLPMVWNNLLANALAATPRGGPSAESAAASGTRVLVTVPAIDATEGGPA